MNQHLASGGPSSLWTSVSGGTSSVPGVHSTWGTPVSVDTRSWGPWCLWTPVPWGAHRASSAWQCSKPSPAPREARASVSSCKDSASPQGSPPVMPLCPLGGPRAEDTFCGRGCAETPPHLCPHHRALEKAPPLFPRRKGAREKSMRFSCGFKVTRQPCQEVSESMSIFSFNSSLAG